MVKPLRLFWLILMCFAFLGLGLLFPEEIQVGEGFKIKVPQLTATFWQKKPTYADISQIRKKFEPPTKKTRQKHPQSGFSRPKAARQYVPDSLRLNAKLRIQYPKNQDTLLHGFFRALKRLERGEQDFVRVLHYGDSQLEGDRITAFLREKFQNTFGGGGLGLLNLVDKLNTKAALAQSASPQWQPTVMYGPRYRRGTGSFFGVLGDFYRFALPGPPAWTKATLQYSLTQYASPAQRKINRLRVLYRNPEAPFELTVQLPNQPEIKEKLEENKRFGMYELPLSTPFEQVSLGFASGQASPEVYAVSLDGVPGITFDNIPLRGSSGIEFSRAEANHFKQQFQELGVKFVILQFGVNIVPNPQASYDWYEDLFFQQLKFLKNLVPNLSVLVVGVSDMSYNTGNGYASYPNIEKIRNAQRKAAFRAGCAFWDLYEAMGGANSMPSWVFAKPVALASRDFTHFTAPGAQLVSEMLYNAILTEYDEYNALFN